MQRQRKKVCFWCAAVCIAILSVSALAVGVYTGKDENIRPKLQNSRISMDSWVSIENSKENRIITFPYEAQKSEGIFQCRIPDTVTEEDVLVFPNHYQRVSVSIEGEEIYSYGMGNHGKYFIPANMKCFVEMKPEYRGKLLEVKIISRQNNSGAVLDQPLWSTGASIVLDILNNNMSAGFFCMIVGVGGIILLAAAAVLAVKRPIEPGKLFVSLGIFMILSALWIVTDSELLQLCIGNSQLIVLVSFEAFFMLPVPFLWFMDQISIHKTKVFRWLRYLFVLNCILQNTLYLAGVMDFIHMVLVTHLIIFVSIIYIVSSMIKEYVRYRLVYAKGILTGIAGFVCLSGISIVLFYRSRGNSDEFFFIIGFILFLLNLLWVSIRKLREFTESGVKEKIYRELAFQDVLTGLGNRNLYEKNLEKYEILDSSVCFSVIVMDINGLKGVNDRYGHSEGDRLIRDGAECIRKAFSEIGECYRIGGDEFVVLMSDVKADAVFCREKLKEVLAEYNKGSEVPLAIAVGVAVKNAGTSGKLKELVKRADHDMYMGKISKDKKVFMQK